MNLNFSGSELYRSFNLIAGIVPSSTIKHILQGVKLEVRNEKVEATVTDLEVLVKCMIPVGAVEGEGSIVLPTARVTNIFREWAGNKEVLVSIDGGNCHLRSGKGSFRVMGEDALQFPVVPVTDIKTFVQVDSEIISGMVGKVVHAVSTVKARSTLCGVFVKIDKDDIVMVAADGNRMSMVKRKVDNPEGVSMGGIVTLKSLTFMQRFTSEFGGNLKIGIGESQILFQGERGVIISQQIDGQYPRYEDVIPKDNDKKVGVRRDELQSAVRMASFMTSEGYRVVKFVFKKGKLALQAKAADVGEAELEINAEYDGPDTEICFNPDYVLDAVKASEGDTIAIELKDNCSAAILRTGHEQLSVIMPIELK